MFLVQRRKVETIKKHGLFNLCLCLLRYLQKTMHHIRVKSHALQREHQLLILVLLQFYKFSESKNVS